MEEYAGMETYAARVRRRVVMDRVDEQTAHLAELGEYARELEEKEVNGRGIE